MSGSLGRNERETINNKMRLDLKGPTYYYPKHNFGKKAAASITIPKEPRKLEPILRVHTQEDKLS